MTAFILALIFSIIGFAAQDHFAYKFLETYDRRVRNYFVWTTIFIYFGTTLIV